MRKKIRDKLTKTKFRIRFYIAMAAVSYATTPLIVHADLNGTWNVLIEAIFPLFLKLGMLLLVFGAIEFAVSMQMEDALQKSRALRLMAAGAITIAVVTSMKPYLLY